MRIHWTSLPPTVHQVQDDNLDLLKREPATPHGTSLVRVAPLERTLSIIMWSCCCYVGGLAHPPITGTLPATPSRLHQWKGTIGRPGDCCGGIYRRSRSLVGIQTFRHHKLEDINLNSDSAINCQGDNAVGKRGSDLWWIPFYNSSTGTRSAIQLLSVSEMTFLKRFWWQSRRKVFLWATKAGISPQLAECKSAKFRKMKSGPSLFWTRRAGPAGTGFPKWSKPYNTSLKLVAFSNLFVTDRVILPGLPHRFFHESCRSK